MSFSKNKQIIFVCLILIILLTSLILYYEKVYPIQQVDISKDLYTQVEVDLADIHHFNIEHTSDLGKVSKISFTFQQGDNDIVYYGMADYEKSLIGKYHFNGAAWSTEPFDL